MGKIENLFLIGGLRYLFYGFLISIIIGFISNSVYPTLAFLGINLILIVIWEIQIRNSQSTSGEKQ